MPAARALIVDDSRTAQHRLKKLLDRYNLEIDLASSAEEALGYLSYRMPNVIFLDHHMEGMDGFEALKIIKANPSTATIPVIMYTAKSGDMYAGQARALGALDTLSKGLMKPSRIEEVLGKLNIETESMKKSEYTEKTANSNVVDLNPRIDEIDTSLGAGDFKVQIARLFELHIADVRTQITENTKFIVRRLANEIKNVSNQESRVDDVPVSVLNEQAIEENRKAGFISNALLCLILLALAAISFQVFQSQKQSASLEEKYQQLADINYQESLLLDDIIATSQPAGNSQQASELDYKTLLDVISWAFSIDTRFEFGSEPFDDAQIVNLQNLTFRLNDAGYRGVIELNVHLGNFCVISGDSGNWTLPDHNTPISQCQFLRDQDVDLSVENYTSLAYVRFEQTTTPIQNGDIEYIVNVSPFEDTRYPYPDISDSLTAGQWNSVAQQNQQIVLQIDAL